MEDWRPGMNQYFTNFERQTTDILEKTSKILSQNGQYFDERMKEHFLKSVKFRLEQTVDAFEIQHAKSHSSPAKDTTETERIAKTEYSSRECTNSSDDCELLPDDIKHEVAISCDNDEQIMGKAEGISTTSQSLNKPESPANESASQNTERLSIDQNSVCSPSTSNQIDMSPSIDQIKTESSFDLDRDTDNIIMEVQTTPTNTQTPEIHRKRKSSRDFSESLDKKPRLTGRNQCTTNDVSNNSSGGRRLKFSCFYCQRMLNNQNVSVEIFDTIEEIKVHCSTQHNDKPIRYYAIGFGACFHCNHVDTYQKLLNHHQVKHQSDVFIVVDQRNRSKCGLCHKIFSNEDMHQHFVENHQPSSLAGIFNPICFTQNEINHLKESSKISHFICEMCSLPIDVTKSSLKSHYEDHSIQYPCSNCNVFKNRNQNELLKHEERIHNVYNSRPKHYGALKKRLKRHYLRTKFIFGNGLVVFKQNLLNNDKDNEFNDREDFNEFISKFVEKKFGEQNIIDKAHKLDAFRERELRIQRKYRNNLCISGISTINKKHLSSIFFDICREIGVKVRSHDINSIFQTRNSDIIVMLNDWDVKKKILNGWKSVGKTPKNIRSIKLDHDFTKFFKALYIAAETARENNRIFSHWYGQNGFNVKRSKDSANSEIIWSEEDLINYIISK